VFVPEKQSSSGSLARAQAIRKQLSPAKQKPTNALPRAGAVQSHEHGPEPISSWAASRPAERVSPRSGSSTEGRFGFKELVAEVGLGHVGLVLSFEVSRLARSSADWHQLLDLCALTGTLIADADGVYSPADFNDRLLLGLKGTMSERSCT
jgi:hypothetical protein